MPFITLIVAVFVLFTAPAAALQEGPLTEREKIKALIDHVASLDGAVFIRNDDEHAAADAADHMRMKWDYAGSRVKTARDFIEHIASRSSMSGEVYLIRFPDGREVKSGEYLSEVLRSIENPASPETPPPTAGSGEPEQDDPTPKKRTGQGMKHLEPLRGHWQGELSGEGSDGSPFTIPINWKGAKVFGGRWIRFEFTSKDELAPGRYLEWEGLFTENPETGEIETVWMTPRLRAFASESRFLNGRLIFFEKGRWDEAGRVLTLIANKQYAPEDDPVEVKSTFTIADDGESFTIVDEDKQPDGSWKTVGTFRLEKSAKGVFRTGGSGD